MLKAVTMEHMDDFDDVKVISMVVGDVPENFIMEAKEIDKENFSEECFGVWVNYEKETGEFAVITDHEDSQLYYVDNSGDKHWLDYLLSEQEVKAVTDACRNVLKSLEKQEKDAGMRIEEKSR